MKVRGSEEEEKVYITKHVYRLQSSEQEKSRNRKMVRLKRIREVWTSSRKMKKETERQVPKKKRAQKTERHYSLVRWSDSSNIQHLRYQKDFHSELIHWRLI